MMLGVSETEGIRWFLIMVGHVFQFFYHIYICLTAKRLSWKGVKNCPFIISIMNEKFNGSIHLMSAFLASGS